MIQLDLTLLALAFCYQNMRKTNRGADAIGMAPCTLIEFGEFS